jgi:hypothetical protein
MPASDMADTPSMSGSPGDDGMGEMGTSDEG